MPYFSSLVPENLAFDPQRVTRALRHRTRLEIAGDQIAADEN